MCPKDSFALPSFKGCSWVCSYTLSSLSAAMWEVAIDTQLDLGAVEFGLDQVIVILYLFVLSLRAHMASHFAGPLMSCGFKAIVMHSKKHL